MWKELDDLASVPLDSSSDPVSRDSVSEMLMSAIRNESNEKEQPIANPKPEVAQTQQQFLPPILREYTEAVDKCTKSASEFIRCASLISEAREAYGKLTKASAEIRKFLIPMRRDFALSWTKRKKRRTFMWLVIRQNLFPNENHRNRPTLNC